MFHKLKVYTLAFMALGLASHDAVADEALMDGVRPFICDGDAIVFMETDDGWTIPTYSTAKVKQTSNGWRLEDTLNGSVMYLRKESNNSWVTDRVSEKGHIKFDCIDVSDSVSQVVTIIKPRLSDAIVETQQNLIRATTNLGIAEQSRAQLMADHRLEMTRIKQALEQAVQSKEELVGRIDDSKNSISINLENYDRLLQAAILMPSLGGELKKLKDAPSSERKGRIGGSSLGSKGLAGDGLVPICIKLLSDNADLNDACHQTLTEFILLEGWE